MISRRQLITSAVAFGASQIASGAELAYPSRPIRFVVPFPPGGGTDYLGRILGKQLTAGLKQAVVVENRDGAAGSVGAALVAKAAPDGYTLLMGASSTMAINPHLYAKLPYDTLTNFAAVSLLASVPIVLYVNKSLRVNSVQELVQYARANPGALNAASAGNGSVGHLSAEMLQKMTGINIVHVPYRGAGPAMTALIGGEVQMMFDSALSGMPHVRAGQLRALANGGATRTDILPGMPTMAESGFPDFKAVVWYGLFVPAGTPGPVIDRLNAQTVRALRRSEVKASLKSQSLEAIGSSATECNTFWKAESARWGAIITAAGIHLD